jgi:prephenate dehydrogenase
MKLNRVAIIGVGLIGASFGLALKERGLADEIYGFGRNEDNLKKAKARGIIDAYSTDITKVCDSADLVVLATPVGVFVEIAREISPFLKKGSIVIDVGSVKGRLVYELESIMPEGVHYVGTHPIAGSDKSGIEYARPDLFKDARCIITPTEKTDPESLSFILELWKDFGCNVELIDPMKHDEVYGAVSHLPHIIAYCLVNTIGQIDSEYIRYAGQGFKDTTRIALSSPELWRDIVVYNRDNLLKLLEVFEKNIEELKRLLEEASSTVTYATKEEIKELFTKAQELRRRLK